MSGKTVALNNQGLKKNFDSSLSPEARFLGSGDEISFETGTQRHKHANSLPVKDVTLGLEIKLGPHWWEASALTITLPLLSLYGLQLVLWTSNSQILLVQAVTYSPKFHFLFQYYYLVSGWLSLSLAYRASKQESLLYLQENLLVPDDWMRLFLSPDKANFNVYHLG